ncbi:MAG: hypothetical protein OXC38_07920 [Gammaproteobacteria bacterium]|nr:hypothetical protein [Gammaproteobacteria bacterium]
MTVEELIRLLEGYPPELRVVVQGYENGFDDVSSERAKVVRVQLDRAAYSWEGRHQEFSPQNKDASIADDAVSALALLRASN